jgi:hypothetical protein
MAGATIAARTGTQEPSSRTKETTMITDQNAAKQTAEPTADNKLFYEYLQVRATVNNFTSSDMILTGSDLSWGKWMQSPVDTPSGDSSTFSSQGRDSSPSGTEGWATWKIADAVIKVTFSCPLNGHNDQSITCTPLGAFKVSSSGTGGDINSVTYKIQKA